MHAFASIVGAIGVMSLGGAVMAADLTAFPRPSVKDPALRLELLSSEPDLVTPIGCAVDRKGRIFVVESHTHFPKADYAGPKADRVLVFSGNVGAKPTVFAEGLRWSMNLAFAPNGRLFLTHRNGLMRLDDADGDGVSESRTPILKLETAGDYPHNGMGGLAIANDGTVYVGVGENLGLPYTLVGAAGSQIRVPAGAGGRIFKCRPDGSALEQVAMGFWNPFGLAFDRSARLLAVDNDPDSRPPCRLLHVIPGGDYGFQFRHGRDGLSPFIAWDGELPGTLPMAAGTGEGPTSVLDLQRTALPPSYAGALLVAASWDHTLEVYRRTPVGISFKASREVLVEGGEDFRPVAMAVAPDGAVVFTDWVKQDYNVHSHGRLWRLSVQDPSLANSNRIGAVIVPPVERDVMRAYGLEPNRNFSLLRNLLRSEDPFVRSVSTTTLVGMPPSEIDRALKWFREPVPAQHCLVALRRALAKNPGGTNVPPGLRDNALRYALAHSDPGVRLAAVVWVVEDHLVSLLREVEQSIHAGPVTPLLLAAHAEALRQLRSPQAAVVAPPTAAHEPESVKVLPVSAVVPGEPSQILGRIINPSEPVHRRRESIRLLAGQHGYSAVEAFRRVASDTSANAELRADAILALSGGHEDHVSDLRSLMSDPSPVVALEMARALRPWVSKPEVKATLESVKAPERVAEAAAFALGRRGTRPVSETDWVRAIGAGKGDVESGRRVFDSSFAGCSKCHRIEGVGGSVGPDLSTIARAANRVKLLQSLQTPSRDIAPQFAQRQVEVRGGESYSGRILGEGTDGSLTLVTGEGQAVYIPKSQIAGQRILTVSLMPDGLLDAMSVADVCDLMAFLESRR